MAIKTNYTPRLTQFIAMPTVLQVGKQTQVTLIPLRGKHLFEDGKEYGIYIYPMTLKRKLDKSVPDLRATAQGGVLSFPYTPAVEGEIEIRFFSENEETREGRHEVAVYAVEEDLFRLRPLKGDLHSHSNRSDGQDDAAEVAANYRRCGYDFSIITDHNRFFGATEAQEAFAALDLDYTILNGEEVHAPDSVYTLLHVVNIMPKTSAARRYVKERPAYEKELAEIEQSLPEGEYRHMLAKAKWAADAIHASGGLAVLPHPFWLQNVYNLPLPFLKMLFESGWFDAYEIVSAQDENGNNLSFAYFNDLRANGFKMPAIGTSDQHNSTDLSVDSRFSRIYTIVFAEDNTRDAIYDAVKKGNVAAVESFPQITRTVTRVHASFRLTMYTRFLLETYFSRTQPICAAEGELMREYSLGVAGAEEGIRAITGRTKRFYEAFFGRTEDTFYHIENYRDAYRRYSAVQEEYGVQTRGSMIDKKKK